MKHAHPHRYIYYPCLCNYIKHTSLKHKITLC